MGKAFAMVEIKAIVIELLICFHVLPTLELEGVQEKLLPL